MELKTGKALATLQFANAVEEIFDVQIVPGTRFPTFGGSPGEDDEVWLLPGQPESSLQNGDLPSAPRR